ncbi:hypothetical protein [Tahibacter soli]|uniref:ELWxxDGT repeat protein n=1 Tax=Tahibacter soli TaxID=2983605 RepID=A0A9X4BN56_9GAMM|nr:hypothetical protein [Tahibacter soli]MDC8016034.1 hypothetical protein [Tahibacter soli]
MRLLLLCTALVAGASAANAQALPPLEVSMVKDTNTAPDEYGSNPGGFRRIGDRVYFYAWTPQTGRELYSTDGTPGGLRLELDLVPGRASVDPPPTAIDRLGDRLIVTAQNRLWAYTGGTAVALTPPDSFNIGLMPRRAMTQVGGRLLIASDSFFSQAVWVTDGTPEGTYRQDAAHGFTLPERMGVDCATAAGTLYTAGPSYALVRNDGTLAGSAIIATLPGATWSAAAGGRCHFLAEVPGGGSALWASDGTAQGSAEIVRFADEAPVSIAAMSGNLYVATRGANFRIRRYAPTDLANPSVVLDVPATAGSLVATRSAVLALVDHSDQSSSVYLGNGSATLAAIHTAPPGDAGIRGASYVQGDTVIVMTSPLATRIDATTGAIATIQSGGALTRTLTATLGDNAIGAGTDDEEVWISDGTDAGTHPLHALWPDTANGFGPLAASARSVAVGDVLVYNTAFDDARNTLWRTDGTAQGTWPLPSAALGGAIPYSIAANGGSIVVKARDAAGLTHLYRTDAQLSGATSAGTTYSSTSEFVTHGDVTLFDCGGSLATMTLCALTPQAVAPFEIGGVSIANPSQPDDNVAAIGDVGGAAILFLPYANEIWRSDGTAPGTFRLSSGDTVATSATHAASIVHKGKLYFAGCRAPDGCSLYATDGTIAGTAPVVPLDPSGIFDARFERFGDAFVFGTSSGWFGGVWRSDGTIAGTERIQLERIERIALSIVGDRIHFKTCCYPPAGFYVSDGTQAGTHAVSSQHPGLTTTDTRLFASVDDAATIFGCSTSTGSMICAMDREGTDIAPIAALGQTARGASIEFLGRTSDAIYVIADDYLHGREPWRIRVREAIFADGFEP